MSVGADRRYGHGLVVGKFYPPHVGHHYLVGEAAQVCDRVTVMVAGSSVESISVADRVGWMSATHASQPNVRVVGVLDDHPIDYGDDAIWELHVSVFAAAAGSPVDAVFTSEAYGDELGRRMGAMAVTVDVDRLVHPCSGTAVRADVRGHWHDLAPATRVGLAVRVAFVGAESTGTTTVSQAVAAALGAPWIREYGRDHTSVVLAEGRAWNAEDFMFIASEQVRLEDEAAVSGPVVICDTDAFATGIWEERYLGRRSPEVAALGEVRPHPLYLLTSHDDVPFVQDGLRDGEHLRAWMTARFVERLEETGRRWELLTGPLDQRIARSLEVIDALIASSWRFADPLRPPN
jgi:NadR type nicotinamide-nucleotide adenylyltransferase